MNSDNSSQRRRATDGRIYASGPEAGEWLQQATLTIRGRSLGSPGEALARDGGPARHPHFVDRRQSIFPNYYQAELDRPRGPPVTSAVRRDRCGYPASWSKRTDPLLQVPRSTYGGPQISEVSPDHARAP
jgi:hypothetical protein